MTDKQWLDERSTYAQGMISLYADRNTLFANIDKMLKLDWTFPEGMPDWVLKVVSTDPRDAVTTVVRTFATIRPRFKVMPMLPNEANRDRANQIEAAVAYNFRQAGRRRDSTIEWSVMRSAAKYAEVAAQIIYLPYQEKILRAMGKDTKRIRAAKRFGDFAFIIHNPANIYPEWSEYGLEGALAVRVQTVNEFMDTWGEKANAIVGEKDYNDGKITYVTSFDYTNYEKRCVWGVCSDMATAQVAGIGIKIMEEENKLGFIPYAITRWGDDLSANPDEAVEPLLQSVYNSGQWDMLNVLESLDSSLSLMRAAQPQYAAETPAGQDLELDNTEPVGSLKLPAGTRNFTPLPNQTVDNRVAMQKNEFKSGIWQSTVSKILQTLEFPSGTAYSSVNQLLSQAAGSLAPYKMLGQNALAEISHLMLCWGKYYDKEYGDGETSLYGQYDTKTKLGMEVSIPYKTIDPDALQIEVILTADMPVDKLQTINGAVLVKQNFRVPEAELLEDLGYGDPKELAERRDQEDFNNAYIQNDLSKIQMETQLEFQQKQEAQSQQMQQEQAMRQQEAAGASASQNGSPAQDQMQGMNPAMGSIPPVSVANGQR